MYVQVYNNNYYMGVVNNVNYIVLPKAIRIYIGLLILGVNTVYIAFCFVRTLAMVGKGLISSLNTQYLCIQAMVLMYLTDETMCVLIPVRRGRDSFYYVHLRGIMF